MSRRALLALLTAALTAVSAVGCSPAEDNNKVASGQESAAVSYPMKLESPYGETVLKEQPKRVAVVSAVDLDIALSLGVVPVISPLYGKVKLDPWETDELTKLNAKLKTYDSTDGVDYEAIAASDPDVILATSGWTLDKDYSKLSKIAPIVSYQGSDGLSSMTWAERTQEAAKALGLSEKGNEVVAAVDKTFADTAAEHPEFKDKTFTYAVVHPEQITYISYKGSDVGFFTKLGFKQPEEASQFSETKAAVSKENLDALNADVLLIGYPFGDEGVLKQSELESDPLFKQLPVVKGGHYAVIDDSIASPLAYPSPLNQVWVLKKLTPVLADAVAGN